MKTFSEWLKERELNEASKKIKDIHAPKTIDMLLTHKIIIPDNFINLPIDTQKKDLDKMCKEHKLTPIYK